MTTTKSINAESHARPTDMELMLYADGELDETRHADVDAFIKRDDSARRKIAALNFASGMVRESALSGPGGSDIASAVMAKIQTSPEVASTKNDAGSGPGPVNIQASRQVSGGRAKAANDNSRGIFTLAAIAVAAAAGMMIWGRMGTEPVRSADRAPVMTQEAPPEPAPAAAAPEAPAPQDAEPEHGVEVAAVDFGAHMGTIFYVPTGAAASSATTTVVWVDDEVAGGK